MSRWPGVAEIRDDRAQRLGRPADVDDDVGARAARRSVASTAYVAPCGDPRPHVFRTGRNELAIAVQAISGADAAVTVLPGTFVRLAADRPVLRITGPESLSKVRLGKTVTVPFALNCEHCPPGSATVSLAFDPVLVQAVGRSSLRLAANGRGSFSFRIVEHGPGLVTISARVGAKRIAARPLVVT